MADIKIVGQSKVKSIKRDFKKEFGLSIRIYDGRNLANDEDNISEVRKNKGPSKDLTIAKHMYVGRLENEFKKNFGLKVLIFDSFDKYHCDQKISLAEALRQCNAIKKQKEKYELRSHLFKNLCKKYKLDPLFTHEKYDHTIIKIEGGFNETEFDIKCELWPNRIVIGYKLNDITRENIVNYLKIYDINSTNKSNLIQIDDVIGNPFFIFKNIITYLLKIEDADHLLNLISYDINDTQISDNYENDNSDDKEDDQEDDQICIKLTVNKRCMFLDYTGINVSNDDYENTLTLRETLSGYVVIKMDKDEFEKYDWEENVEFEVTNYELVDVMYDVNGNEYIWEYEADDEEEIESLENTIDENLGIYEGYIGEDNYYEKNAYLINEITAEIVNEDDHYNPYGSGF